MMGPPPIIADLLSSRGFLFYYGEPGVGKTVLANLFALTINRYLGMKSCYIATEPGSLLLNGVEDSAVYRFAGSLDMVLEFVVECSKEGIPIIIDTINGFYDGSSREARLLSLSAALMRVAPVPVVTSGQVRGQTRPWGGEWIAPWATHVAMVRRLRKGVSVAAFLKPRRVFVAFRVGPGGDVLKWL
jgi:hypothetical protein